MTLQPCIPSESVFGDGVDNDCDGDIDEELCTGANLHTDTDLDGQIDEDCAINREIGHGMCSTCSYTYTYTCTCHS